MLFTYQNGDVKDSCKMIIGKCIKIKEGRLLNVGMCDLGKGIGGEGWFRETDMSY